MIKVTLFTKSDCALCEEVKADLERLQSEIPHQLQEVDIEADPVLHNRYEEIIPVVKVGPYTLEAPIDAAGLKVALAATRDGLKDTPATTNVSRRRAISLNKILLFITRHWLALINLLVLVYIGLPFGAPILMKTGAMRPAELIYKLYSPLCHQLAFRSWFLFGEQSAYPREIAGTSLRSYGEVTGFDENDFFGAREFLGNEKVGYKVALCERDIGIYVAILVAGLLFSLVRGRVKPLSIRIWLLIGILPIALDGGSQLISALPVFSFPVRESTPFLRSITGAMFGVMNVWLAYPYLEESMKDVRATVAAKLSAAGAPL